MSTDLTTARSTIRRIATTSARSMIKVAATTWDVLDRPQAGVVVLIYHRVGHGTGGQMDLEPSEFDDQLAWLRANATILTLDEAADRLRATPTAGPTEPGVVITFDDGTTDWIDHVLPALEHHRAPATFYVATDFIDRGLPLPGDGRPLSWVGLHELAASPLVTIGSHTHRHTLLDRLPAAEVAEELDRSIGMLSERLGTDIQHFAYPKAVAGSSAADREVRSRFRTAVLAGTRANLVGADLHRLTRSPIQRADSHRSFRHKVAGGMHLEDDLRQTLNRMRYRGMTT